MFRDRIERVRRLASRSVSWSSARLAVAEVALVFVGVLLALWVEGWSQGRHEDDLRDRYLAALVHDVDSDIARLEAAIGSNRDRISAPLGRAIDVFVAEEILDGDTLGFIRDVQMAAYMNVPRRQEATFRDLEGSGNLQLIGDLDTRAALFDYYGFWEWLDQYHDAFLTTKFQTIGLGVTEAIPARLFTYAYDVTDRLSPDRRRIDLESVLADDDLESLVFAAWTIARWQEGHFERMLERARSLRAALLAASS